MDHRLHALAGLHLNDVDDVRALGGLAALGDLIALLAVYLAGIGEEEDIVVGRGGENVHHAVLFARGDALFAHAALTLRGVLARARALDIAVARERKDALLLFDEVFDVDLVLDLLNFGLARIAVLVADLKKLVLQNTLEHRLVGEKFFKVGDLLFQFVELVLELLAVKSLQGLQAHIEDRLRLHIGEGEALHELFLRVVVACADDVDDLVDVVLRDEKALQQVLALARFFEVVLRSARDKLFLEGKILVDDVAQGQDLRLLLVIHKRQHIDGKARLHLRLGKEAV